MATLLTPEERRAFIAAATAITSVIEQAELLKQQALEGTLSPTEQQGERVAGLVGKGKEHTLAMAQIFANHHPQLAGIRFRGRLFFYKPGQGREGVEIVLEDDIETIE